VLATVALFTIVGHWNDWFGAYIYMSKPQHYPLQTYLMSMLNLDLTKVTDFKQRQLLQLMSPKTLRAAMVFVTALPILMAYPFLQKYFAKGLVLGSVKG
jgi:putative aldouronate transport system permease protein